MTKKDDRRSSHVNELRDHWPQLIGVYTMAVDETYERMASDPRGAPTNQAAPSVVSFKRGVSAPFMLHASQRRHHLMCFSPPSPGQPRFGGHCIAASSPRVLNHFASTVLAHSSTPTLMLLRSISTPFNVRSLGFLEPTDADAAASRSAPPSGPRVIALADDGTRFAVVHGFGPATDDDDDNDDGDDESSPEQPLLVYSFADFGISAVDDVAIDGGLMAMIGKRVSQGSERCLFLGDLVENQPHARVRFDAHSAMPLKPFFGSEDDCAVAVSQSGSTKSVLIVGGGSVLCVTAAQTVAAASKDCSWAVRATYTCLAGVDAQRPFGVVALDASLSGSSSGATFQWCCWQSGAQLAAGGGPADRGVRPTRSTLISPADLLAGKLNDVEVWQSREHTLQGGRENTSTGVTSWNDVYAAATQLSPGSSQPHFDNRSEPSHLLEALPSESTLVLVRFSMCAPTDASCSIQDATLITLAPEPTVRHNHFLDATGTVAANRNGAVLVSVLPRSDKAGNDHVTLGYLPDRAFTSCKRLEFPQLDNAFVASLGLESDGESMLALVGLAHESSSTAPARATSQFSAPGASASIQQSQSAPTSGGCPDADAVIDDGGALREHSTHKQYILDLTVRKRRWEVTPTAIVPCFVTDVSAADSSEAAVTTGGSTTNEAAVTVMILSTICAKLDALQQTVHNRFDQLESRLERLERLAMTKDAK
jgi:hypothetical protein